MGALRDCEAIVHAVLGQPVNSITTMAFVIGGVVVIARTDHLWIGIASIATGVGSFLFHGPMPPYGQWAHDAGIAWLLLVVAAHGRAWQRWAHLPGLLVVGAVVAVPQAADPLAVGLAALALVVLVVRDVSRHTLAPLALLVTVAIIGRLGSTGGPLCDPGSIWQPHGVWHVGAATAVAWWALGLDRDVADG